jgi:hypothetical protein
MLASIKPSLINAFAFLLARHPCSTPCTMSKHALLVSKGDRYVSATEKVLHLRPQTLCPCFTSHSASGNAEMKTSLSLWPVSSSFKPSSLHIFGHPKPKQ